MIENTQSVTNLKLFDIDIKLLDLINYFLIRIIIRKQKIFNTRWKVEMKVEKFCESSISSFNFKWRGIL